ncbi:MAG: DUF2148 domain-containing protein [Nitrososphaerota archaeon]
MMEGGDLIRNGVVEVAKLMAISAITAPKARGNENIVVKILDKPEELEALARKMDELAETYGDFFKRDAENVRKSHAVILIGCKILNLELKSPKNWKIDADTVCSLVNLGIAIGSAVKTASIHNVDNRIMFSIGVAAQEGKMMDADYVFGIPLTASSKNPYFDRIWPPKK